MFDRRIKISDADAMTEQFFFGYGSLVNTATHEYTPTEHMRLIGWRRCWRQVQDYPVALLSAHAHTDSMIDGLIAPVPNNDWTALDIRERGYDRIALTLNAQTMPHRTIDLAIYSVPGPPTETTLTKQPILLSYLDVVLQGYLRRFGISEAEGFLTSTDGWNRPVLNDRATPHYPRHQVLTMLETKFVDAALKQLQVDIITL